MRLKKFFVSTVLFAKYSSQSVTEAYDQGDTEIPVVYPNDLYLSTM